MWIYNKTGCEYLRHKENGNLYDREDETKLVGLIVNRDIFSIDANLPILKLPAQNKVAKTTIK